MTLVAAGTSPLAALNRRAGGQAGRRVQVGTGIGRAVRCAAGITRAPLVPGHAPAPAAWPGKLHRRACPCPPALLPCPRPPNRAPSPGLRACEESGRHLELHIHVCSAAQGRQAQRRQPLRLGAVVLAAAQGGQGGEVGPGRRLGRGRVGGARPAHVCWLQHMYASSRLRWLCPAGHARPRGSSLTPPRWGGR